MKFQIKNRFTGQTQFECELSADLFDDSYSIKLGFAVKKAIEVKANLSEANLSKADLSWANLSEANLSWADLSWANLSKANLSKANLSEADLSWANLSKANLSEANLSWANLSKANLSKANLSKANLSWANLSEANLSEANLSWANLSEANLSEAKNNVFAILLYAKNEVPALIESIKGGQIDGSMYEGKCACLVGTIAKIKGVQYENMNGIEPRSSSAAERFFLAIKEGDTPETNPASKIALEWCEEFLTLINA